MDDDVWNQLLHQQRLTNQILRAAYRPQLEALGRTVAADPVMTEILRELAGGAKPAGLVKAAVAGTTKASDSTLKRRLSEMETLGLLERRGAGGGVSYRATGLVVLD